jgi:hypothetical protein
VQVKKLEAKPVTYIEGKIVECPHCHANQEPLDEYEADAVYECEVCWEHYTVPMRFIEKAQQDQEYGQRVTQAELSALEKRLARLEKELGIKR